MQYYEQIVANRHSCRNFAKKPVGEDLLYKLLTYYDDRTRNLTEHIKTFIKFFDGSVCEKLGHYVGYNGHCIKAPAYMVVYSEEKGRYLENAGFIAEALTLKMTELGLSACWQTVNNAEAVKEVLGKETDMVVACVVAFGYRDKKNKEKPVEKISLDELTFGTKYGQDIDPTSFYRELEDGLRAMAHSQSFLNLLSQQQKTGLIRNTLFSCQKPPQRFSFHLSGQAVFHTCPSQWLLNNQMVVRHYLALLLDTDEPKFRQM